MAVTSPIDNFVTDGIDADQYAVGKAGTGYALAYTMIWVTAGKDGMHQHTVVKPGDWVEVEDLDSTAVSRELTDISLRTEPGQGPDAARAAELLALSDDTESKVFIGQARNRYKHAVWWIDPPMSKRIFKIDGNPEGWNADDFAGTSPSLFWNKYKAIR